MCNRRSRLMCATISASCSAFRGRGPVAQHDAAYVRFSEEIGTGELQIVQGSLRIEEKRVATPAGKETMVSGRRHPRPRPSRDWGSFEDYVPAVACPGGLFPFNTAQCRSLRSVLRGREADSVCDIGDGVTVGVDLKLIDRLGREGFVCRGPKRVHTDGWMLA